MKRSLLLSAVIPLGTAAALLSACGSTGATAAAAGSDSSGGSASSGGTVTVYSADGLGDWFKKEFADFTSQTGVTVNYVEAGSGEVVSRAQREKSNPQADVIVTLPPFIQQADKDGLLTDLGADTSAIAAADKGSDGHWSSLVNNYSCFIVSSKADPAPKTWQDLLDPRFKGKLQYSTPGQAGDGTAVLIELEHVLGGKQPALDYLQKLQANNVGPSSSTGKLQPKVSSGQLLVANGDVQMNLASIQQDKSAFSVFFPADAKGERTALALPYAIGRAAGAPHADNGKKLVEFLLSKKVQSTVSSGALGFPVRTDVTADDANAKLLQQTMAGVQVYHPDWDSVLSSLDSDVSSYNAAVGG
jgi:2-aminoethylphosphonate transport system substrate-binding protein